MKLKNWILTVILFVLAWGEVFSQIEFRIPFSCEHVKVAEKQAFSEILNKRFANPLLVYPYTERALKLYGTCKDSTIYFHLVYSDIVKRFLINKKVSKDLEALIHKIKKDQQFLFLAYNELLFESLFAGQYYQLDSAISKIPWERFTPFQQSIFARRLVISLDELLKDNHSLVFVKSKILVTDSLMHYFENGLELSHLGILMDSLYKTGNVIEANMIGNNAFSQYRRSNPLELVRSYSKVRNYLFDFGFKTNKYALEYLYPEIGISDNDFMDDMLKYVLHDKEPVAIPRYVFKLSTWEVACLSISGFLFLFSFVYYLVARTKGRKLVKGLVAERRFIYQSILIRIKAFERQLDREAAEK